MTDGEKNYNAGSAHRAEIHKEINSTPLVINRKEFVKTPEEKGKLATAQSNFKRNGLKQWNERNRPGNNKTA